MTGSGSLTLVGGGLIGNTSGAISGGTLAGSASGELIVITPANLTIGSVIADNGGATALTKAGSATLTLTGSNTYSGATTIGAGTLQIGNGGASGTLGTGPVTDNSALVFNLSGATTFGGAISGVGSLTQAGNGALMLSGSNDYTRRHDGQRRHMYVTDSDALPDGTSLTVGPGGTFVFDPSASAAPRCQPRFARRFARRAVRGPRTGRPGAVGGGALECGHLLPLFFPAGGHTGSQDIQNNPVTLENEP